MYVHALRWRLSWLAFFVLVSSSSALAFADRPLDVGVELAGGTLGPYATMYEDATGALEIADVSAPSFLPRFGQAIDGAPSLGYTSSAYWIRLPVCNGQRQSRRWMLELAYPLLDEVTLYKPRADGRFDVVATGDMFPFREREVAYQNFLFNLEEPPQSRTAYYLRVHTTGALKLPLLAWTAKPFLEHQHVTWAALCMFYGALIIMACHSLVVFAATRRSEHILGAAYMLGVLAFSFTFAGHTLEFLLPDSPALVHRILPISLGGALLFAALFVRTGFERASRLYRAATAVAWFFAALLVLSLLAPFAIGMRALTYGTAIMMLTALVYGALAARSGERVATLFLFAWCAPMLGVFVTTVHLLGLLPTNLLTTWSVQIGICIQVVLISSSLADKLNSTRAVLGKVNTDLRLKVDELSRAVGEANLATEQAARATSLRDQFMAAMAHEFVRRSTRSSTFPRASSRIFRPADTRCAGAATQSTSSRPRTMSPISSPAPTAEHSDRSKQAACSSTSPTRRTPVVFCCAWSSRDTRSCGW